MSRSTSPAYSLTIRARIPNRPGSFAKLAEVIGNVGGDLGMVDILAETRETILREITVDATGPEHEKEIAAAVRGLGGIEILEIEDCTFAYHDGGKMVIDNRGSLVTQADLSMAYTPGVARVSLAVADDKRQAYNLTIKGNTVAVVSDGTAVLGLGDIGPEGALPVMEGKALLFKKFADVDAFPLCIGTKDVDEIVNFVKLIAPTFGGINLEDIAAPRCFEIEERLKREVDIPVFHDDQHGTAVVTMAALINALKLTKKKIGELKIVVCGIGAAGVACSKILLGAGARNIVGVDSVGAIYRGRTERMNVAKDWYAENTNPEGLHGSLSEVMQGADIFLGLSGPDILSVDEVKKMNKDPIVFAMANPIPEIMPELALPHVAVMATGRSDYPNQINNVLAFPGIFRGALDICATDITEGMKLAAAHAIANVLEEERLAPDYIIPSALDARVAPAVAEAVRQAAIADGVAREDFPTMPGFEEIGR